MNTKLREKIEREVPELRGIGGPFACMDPAKIISEHSPTDYRCGQVDWEDAERSDQKWVTTDNGSTYRELGECEEARDEIVSDLEGKKTDLDAKLENANESEQEGIEAEIEALENEIDEPKLGRF